MSYSVNLEIGNVGGSIHVSDVQTRLHLVNLGSIPGAELYIILLLDQSKLIRKLDHEFGPYLELTLLGRMSKISEECLISDCLKCKMEMNVCRLIAACQSKVKTNLL